MKPRHQDRAADDDDDPDGNDEPVVARHGLAEPGERRAFGETELKVGGSLPLATSDKLTSDFRLPTPDSIVGTIRGLAVRGLAAHLAQSASALPRSREVPVSGNDPGQRQRSSSCPCDRSVATGQVRLVPDPRGWPRRHRDGLERPSPIAAPGMLTLESFKSRRIRGLTPKSQQGCWAFGDRRSAIGRKSDVGSRRSESRG